MSLRLFGLHLVILCGFLFSRAGTAEVGDDPESYHISARSHPHNAAAADRIVPPEQWIVKPGKPAPVLSPKQVFALMDALLGDWVGWTVESEKDICGFQLVNATGDSYYELIVIGDPSSRGFCTTYSVVRRTRSGWTVQDFEAFEPGGVKATFQDLKGNGQRELAIPRILAEGRHGIDPKAMWTAVYEWNGSSYVRADQRYAAFYRKRLNALNQQIAAERMQHWKEEDLAADYVERDCLLRFLEIDRRAGLDRALQWAQSNSDELKNWAVQVFEQIGGSEVRPPLEEWSHNADSWIATEATRVLFQFHAQ